MGTTYTVKYLSDGLKNLPFPEKVRSQLDLLPEEVSRQMSTYREDSEISRFNKIREAGKPMSIAADFTAVTAETVRLNKTTHSALDVTVGPLINLWGFGPDKQLTCNPSAEEIKRMSSVMDIDKISLSRSNGSATLAKSRPEVYLDLSSITRSFGVDKFALYLKSLGVRDYLVEIDSELRGRGRNAQDGPWCIGVEQPRLLQGGDTQIIVSLDDRTPAASGDYHNFHTDKQGKRLSHIINPQKMEPTSHNLASTSVVTDTATAAGGLSAGLFVLGEEKVLTPVEQRGLTVFLIIRTRDGHRTEMSSKFKQPIR